MRIAVESVEVLVRQVLDETRRTLDVPSVHNFLDRLQGGQVIRAMIGNTTTRPGAFESSSIAYSLPIIPVATPVATTVDPVHAEPPPVEKATRASAEPIAAKPPVPTGTRVRVLTGAYQGWTGPLRWSPAKGVYNVSLTGADGQRTQTTLSPGRLGTSWEVVTEVSPKGQRAPRKRQEVQA
jgi:hypothetical protein